MYFELFFAYYNDANITYLLEYCNYIPFFYFLPYQISSNTLNTTTDELKVEIAIAAYIATRDSSTRRQHYAREAETAHAQRAQPSVGRCPP